MAIWPFSSPHRNFRLHSEKIVKLVKKINEGGQAQSSFLRSLQRIFSTLKENTSKTKDSSKSCLTYDLEIIIE